MCLFVPCVVIQRQMKELMVRAIYCEMLGYEASFSYIHAIKLAQQGTALEKRVGMFFCNELKSSLLPQHPHPTLLQYSCSLMINTRCMISSFLRF